MKNLLKLTIVALSVFAVSQVEAAGAVPAGYQVAYQDCLAQCKKNNANFAQKGMTVQTNCPFSCVAQINQLEQSILPAAPGLSGSRNK